MELSKQNIDTVLMLIFGCVIRVITVYKSIKNQTLVVLLDGWKHSENTLEIQQTLGCLFELVKTGCNLIDQPINQILPNSLEMTWCAQWGVSPLGAVLSAPTLLGFSFMWCYYNLIKYSFVLVPSSISLDWNSDFECMCVCAHAFLSVCDQRQGKAFWSSYDKASDETQRHMCRNPAAPLSPSGPSFVRPQGISKDQHLKDTEAGGNRVKDNMNIFG